MHQKHAYISTKTMHMYASMQCAHTRMLVQDCLHAPYAFSVHESMIVFVLAISDNSNAAATRVYISLTDSFLAYAYIYIFPLLMHENAIQCDVRNQLENYWAVMSSRRTLKSCMRTWRIQGKWTVTATVWGRE